MLEKAPRNLFVSRIQSQSEIGGQHRWSAMLGPIVGVRNGTGASAIFRCPLMRAGRTLGEFPFVAEQVLEEAVAPLGWGRGPDDFQAAGDRVITLAGAKFG